MNVCAAVFSVPYFAVRVGRRREGVAETYEITALHFRRAEATAGLARGVCFLHTARGLG